MQILSFPDFVSICLFLHRGQLVIISFNNVAVVVMVVVIGLLSLFLATISFFWAIKSFSRGVVIISLDLLLHFCPFGHKHPTHFSEAFLFGLFERRVRVVIVGEHVWPIVQRHDVRISATLEQSQGNLRMASLTGQVEGGYIPASVAAGAVSTV